jgi:dynein heavy chain, axonemal
MLVGPTSGGKTTNFKVLAHAMSALKEKMPDQDLYKKVEYKILNPKSITMGELYGEVSEETNEWVDGLASSVMREFAVSESMDALWTVFDGPVDSLWIENMNTVLDDSMTLCLANGERMKLRPNMRMLFEVQDLAVASPATVSRCGMVYMTPSELGWMPYVDSWLDRYIKNNPNLPPTEPGKEDLSILAITKDLFIAYIQHSLDVINTIRDQETMRTYDI